MRVPSPLRTPIGAALLSAVFPGLGQAAAGNRNRGAIVAIPALATLGALLAIVIFSRSSLLDAAFNQTWLTSLLLVDVIALVYHLWAVADSYLLAAKEPEALPRKRTRTPVRPTWPAVAAIAIIITGTLGVHAAVASFVMDAKNGVGCISALTPCGFGAQGTQTFQPLDTADPQLLDSPGTGSATASKGPAGTLDPKALPSYLVPPKAQDWAVDGQFNVLLLGVDYEPNTSRASYLRPDTMMVMHMDIASGRAALISIPRGTQCVPLPQSIGAHYLSQDSSMGCPAYTWPYMLNWLAAEAGWGGVTGTKAVANFPFYQDATAGQANDPLAFQRAVEATSEAIETLTNLTIDGFVMINIEGLAQLIDALGGIDITVPSKVTDYPCGPTGTWEAKWRVCDLNTGVKNVNDPSKAHSGYQVPVGELSEMVSDAAKSNGKQTISWQGTTDPTNGTDIAFTIQAGAQHMDGPWAVAYARTRIYYTDWDRNTRQQLVLKSLRSSVDPCKLLTNIGNLGSLIDSLSMFDTNLPLSDVSKWAGMAQHVLGNNVQSLTLDPTTLQTPSTTYINATSWATAKSLVSHSLDKAPTPAASSGSGGGNNGGGFTC